MNIEKAIKIGSQILSENNVKTFKLDSEILMSNVIKKERSFMILNSQDKLKKSFFNHYYNLIKQRSFGKPVAYLLGKKEFWNLEFKISKHVLIPRPDTELLIEETLKISKNKNRLISSISSPILCRSWYAES